VKRRAFLATSLALAAVPERRLSVWKTLGGLREEDGAAPIPGARWYQAEAAGDGMAFEFPAGSLGEFKWITADLLLDGRDLAVFEIALSEGKGRSFRLHFGALAECSLRMRFDLALLDQSHWMADREGAFLKPLCSGDRVELAKVDRLSLTVHRKGPRPVRWAMTELRATANTPARLTDPVLPKGALLDEFGQSTLHEWPAKTRSEAELKTRIQGQLESSATQAWPETWTTWGGLKALKIAEPSGFFGVRRHAERWWLVDPSGCAFWSAGADCVVALIDSRIDTLETALRWMPEVRRGGRPGAKSVNFLEANLIRAFGATEWHEKWTRIALGELKRLRFNTVGNWSETELAAKVNFPYVRPLSFRPTRSGAIYRDFPDVFQPAFESDCADCAAQLKSTAADPALIGYFLMNEPTWGFSSELPAEGMLYQTHDCATRAELARWLRARHEGDAALAKAWGQETTFERVARGRWQGTFSPAALKDLAEFSSVMVERYFKTLSTACRAVDKNHLNLGMRWAGVPPEWAVRGMSSFDVFSLNCYEQKLPRKTTDRIHELLKMPALVGEWHFGALDVGLPGSGIGHLKNQADRARAYRVYFEDAAANPNCVGAHWFTLYDQSAIGRFDGENYNIGFLDVCHRPYDELSKGAILSHERLYDLAAGRASMYADAPQYLDRLFL
jgi:hypothetical protein